MDRTEIDLIEKLNKMSRELREIVFRIADNIDFVNHICRGKAVSIFSFKKKGW